MTTIDPNVGSRNWTKFVLMEGNSISRLSTAPDTFKTSTGERPTDEWLVTDGYRGYIDNGPPNYNKYEEKVIKVPLKELTVGTNNTVVQTYQVVPLSEEEKAQMNNILSNEINEERERRINTGCNILINGVGTIAVKGSSEDMRNLTNLGLMANVLVLTNQNTTIPFRDDTNTIYNLTPTQMSEVWRKAVAYVSSLYQASWSLKDQAALPQDYKDNKYWPSRNI